MRNTYADVGLLAGSLLLACSRSETPANVKSSAAEPAAVVAKALGKGHVPEQSPWASRASCEQALERAKSTRKGPASPRLATWNVRYFPDGSEQRAEDQPTDLDWLACSIALLDVDVLAVQEFKKTEHAKASADELLRKLATLTGRSYRLELARCEPNEVQHPGLLYDERRVSVQFVRDVPELNADAKCSNLASPGFASYLSFEAGPDFHFVVIHAYAGNTRREHAKRGLFVDALQRVSGQLERIHPDRDVVVTGDFNTTGCSDCEPRIASTEETRALAARLSSFPAPLRLLPATEACSFAASSEPVLLDHFLVSASMREVSEGTQAQVSGSCAVAHCANTFPKAKAEKNLSDHCPLVLELAGADLD
jgi:endonuclease/exonuclease/phosphatase family metal-dependent hydrolase